MNRQHKKGWPLRQKANHPKETVNNRIFKSLS